MIKKVELCAALVVVNIAVRPTTIFWNFEASGIG